MRQADLVTTRRDGTRVLYRLAGGDVAHLYALLRAVAQSHLPDVEAARVAYPGDDGGQPMTRDDLQRLAKTRRVTVLDVRPREEYAGGHIRGAVSIPVDEAVRLLAAHGRTATRLANGMLEWRLAGLPVAA